LSLSLKLGGKINGVEKEKGNQVTKEEEEVLDDPVEEEEGGLKDEEVEEAREVVSEKPMSKDLRDGLALVISQ